VVDGSVIGGGVTLSEVVGLYLGGVSSKPFPINLIQIIGFHDKTADDTSTIGCLHSNTDFSEKDVEVASDGRCLSFDVHDEVCTICRIVCHRGTFSIGEVVALALSKVDGDGLTKSCVGWTGIVSGWVTAGEGLC